MVFVGIDPGVNGSMVCIEPGNKTGVYHCLSWLKDNTNYEKVADWLSDLQPKDTQVVLERVSGWIGGRKDALGNSQPGSRMFVFGQSYGALQMALTCLGFDYHTVRPYHWQKFLSLDRPKQLSKSQYKPYLKNKAQNLFPGLSVTLYLADALLLGVYACKLFKQTI